MVYGLFYLIFAYCILLMKFFRALRSNELNKLNKNQGLTAHCDNCKCKECILEDCCKINDRQHVNSGSKAKIKSRYISATYEEHIAAWWSSNTDGKPKYSLTTAKSATYVEIDMEYNPDKIIDTCEQDYGATANNRAKSSCEVLIKDDIGMENITNIYRVKQILKKEFDSLPDTYTKNGLFFKKIHSNVQKKDKYMLSLKIPEINFNIESDDFPIDYLLTDNDADTDYESEINDSMDIDSQEMNTDYKDNMDSQQEVIGLTNDNEGMNNSQEGTTDVESEGEYMRRYRNNTTKNKVVKANRQVKNTTNKKKRSLRELDDPYILSEIERNRRGGATKKKKKVLKKKQTKRTKTKKKQSK